MSACLPLAHWCIQVSSSSPSLLLVSCYCCCRFSLTSFLLFLFLPPLMTRTFHSFSVHRFVLTGWVFGLVCVYVCVLVAHVFVLSFSRGMNWIVSVLLLFSSSFRTSGLSLSPVCPLSFTCFFSQRPCHSSAHPLNSHSHTYIFSLSLLDIYTATLTSRTKHHIHTST